MTFPELIHMLDGAYDPSGDVLLSDYLNPEGGINTHAGSRGDTLALFVVQELRDTFDPSATDIAQLRTADDAMDDAIQELVRLQLVIQGADPLANPKNKGSALVYITPASGVGGEWPAPVRFDLKKTTKEFVTNYAESCRAKGMKARIVWP